MNFPWLEQLLDTFRHERIFIARLTQLHGLPLLHVNANEWSDCARIAKERGVRFAGLWVTELTDKFQIDMALAINNKYLLLRTELTDIANPTLASCSRIYLAASRFERHAHDLLGVNFIGSLDNRPWTRHAAWGAEEFPLRAKFVQKEKSNNSSSSDAAIDNAYQFTSIAGSGVYEIPVGPIHAGIIEPGHFRFHVAGEDILQLEEQLGFVHRGIEKLAVGRTPEGLLRLASRVSGDSTVAYAWATCQAIERALAIAVPGHVSLLRALLAERERIANHLWDVAAICNDVGFTFGYYQFGRLRELWGRTNAKVFGSRLLMDLLEIGTVKVTLEREQIASLQDELQILTTELKELQPIITENSSLQNRLQTTGVLTTELAKELGTTGVVARASGVSCDARIYEPYAPYETFAINEPVLANGDVAARLQVRFMEIGASVDVLQKLLAENLSVEVFEAVSSGSCHCGYPASVHKCTCTGAPPPCHPSEMLTLQQESIAHEGIGLVEGWRGTILVYVAFTEALKVARYFPIDPSWFSWLALERMLGNDIVPDFPVCNKSVNGSYAGVDL